MGRQFKSLVLLGFFVFARPILAANEAMQSFTLSGPVYQAGTTAPLLDSNLTIKVQVLNPAKTCVLYEEQQTYDTAVTNGIFNIQVGSSYPNAKRTSSDPGNSMALVYQNIAAIPGTNVPTQTCGGSYTPTAGATRYFRVTFTPSSTGTPDTMNPDIAMGSVPSALVAQSLQGLERAGVLQVRSDASYSLSQANLESTFSSSMYPRLQALLAGTSTQYLSAMPSAAVSFNSQRLSGVGDPTSAQDVATKNYVDSYLAGKAVDMTAVGAGIGNGKTLVWDAAMNKWMAMTFNVDVGTTANKIVALNGSAQLPALDGSKLTLINAVKIGSRTVSSAAPTTGQVLGWTGSQWEPTTVSGGTTAFGTAATKDVGTSAGNIVVLNGSGQLPTLDGSNLTNITSSKLGSRTVSSAMPSVGQVLMWNGNFWGPQTISAGSSGDGIGFICALGDSVQYTASGWDCASPTMGSGTVTTLYMGVGLVGGTITTAGSISVDVGTTANKIVRLNASAQLPAVDGSLLTNISSSKLSGRTVSTALPSAGQSLAWNGSQWEPQTVSDGSSSYAFVQSGNSFSAAASLGTTDAYSLNFKTNNNIAMTIVPGGSVGIGTTSPAAGAILDIVSSGSAGSAIVLPRDSTASRPASPTNGMVRYNTTTAKTEFYENGAWVNFTSSSDARLKKDVVNVNNALVMIDQMRPVYFNWDFSNPKAVGYADKHQLGFIAQELEQVVPEVVNVGGDGYRTVDYGKIVSIAIAAAKDLKAQVKTLSEENAELKARLEKQSQDLEAIKRRLDMTR